MQESTGRETDELGVGSDKAPGEEIPVCQRVAIIMVALGEEASGQVMKYLSDFEIEEIADTKNVTPQIMDLVLEDFEQHQMAGHYIIQGGVDFARDVLERAVGARKAQQPTDITSLVQRQQSPGKRVDPL